ncbi:branched-chain amino acid ABC transporter permease [Nocardioides perillae]|uniref:Branched-chain amino acid transport system permease protein n=1 Tax=Nocardioides perillae TaxID=1119534 RepID=A0A7Y9UVD1_9ACTN|nr:branched-chain amino acid ABC transporter permease [Nocardioides perillae]NYG56565.1 branched-chain amino acid transport system permease protein [Nocardioides perillae]
MEQLLESLVRGLGTGSVYALLALAFVIIYKATTVISFAQPAFMLTGAVITSYVTPAIGVLAITGLSFFVSVTIAAILTAGVALVVERLAIRPMVGKAVFTVAIITIGIDIAVRVVVNGFIGLGARPIGFPWGLDRVELLGLDVQIRHLVMMGTVAVVVAALFWFFQRTRWGLAMRAAAFDQEAAMTQGVSVGGVFALSWGMAGALAAIAGSLLATGAGVDRQLWLVALVALPAIILGGLDSLEGAVVGGLAVGVVESLVGTYQRDFAPWLGDNFAVVSPYVLMLVVLLAKPYGIFGTAEVRRV